MNCTVAKPLLTEKTTNLAKRGWYVFIVNKKASKGGIRAEINDIFGVTVKSIKTASFKGKIKKSLTKRGRVYKRPDYKKAFVKLEKGQKISLFEPEEKGKKKSG